MSQNNVHLRYEVWVTDIINEAGLCVDWRFNACFDERSDAEKERDWYHRQGYAVDIRMRTTRYQRPEHMTHG